jgi:EF hand
LASRKIHTGKIEREHKMKIKMKIMLPILALGASAFVAGAQDDNGGPPPDGGQGPGGRHRPPPLPLVMALDVNHDHVIDANEIANASAELLTLDKNGDGVLTTNEYLPQRPPQSGDSGAGAFHPPTPMIVCALDANHDGVIDAKEIANAPAELKTLDKNGDGQLTPDEFIGPRPSSAGRDNDNGAPPGPPPDQQ